MTATRHGRARGRTRREREAERRRQAQRGRLSFSLPVISGLALVGGVVLIAAAVVFAPRPGSGAPIASIAPGVAGTYSGLPTDGFALGRSDAPVTIDLYEDFQCPACRRWGETVFPALVDNELRSGQARLVFHDFSFIGPESMTAARAGHAAARQGRFWDMWATIYANQGGENSGALGVARLTEMARGLGLDIDRFTSDIAIGVTGPAVDASNAAARRAGVDSTPTIAVDGQLMVGAGYEEIAAAVADAASR